VFTIDLHCHSAHSIDGVASVDELLEQAAAVGLDGIAVTDHDTLAGGREAVDLAPEYGLVAIPGVEVTSTAGHVLGLGVDSLVPKGLSFDETVEGIQDAGGTAVVPHPYQERLRHGVLANVEPHELAAADAIEIYNSRFVTGRSNRQAERLAEQLAMPVTAASDAHIPDMVGQAVTHVDTDERDPEALLAAIREGRTETEGRRTPFNAWLRQAAGSARKHARRGVEQLR
jgi:predicted metal-dependent phosphoesterase TrpH